MAIAPRIFVAAPGRPRVIGALSTLLVYQLVGEVTVRALRVPLPGPVLGMLLLFTTLLWRGWVGAGLEATSGALLTHLSLLFVPAGVGIVRHLSLLREQGLPLLITLVLSTLLTLAVTGWTLQVQTGVRRGDG